MKFANKILLLCGLFFTVIGMSYGLWYALFDEHQTLQGMGTTLASSFAMAADNNLNEGIKTLQQFKEISSEYKREVHAHSHIITLSMVMILLSACIHRVSFSERVRNILAIMLVSGTVLFPLGVFLQSFALAALGKLMAGVGAISYTLGFAGITLGFFKAEKTSACNKTVNRQYTA